MDTEKERRRMFYDYQYRSDKLTMFVKEMARSREFPWLTEEQVVFDDYGNIALPWMADPEELIDDKIPALMRYDDEHKRLAERTIRLRLFLDAFAFFGLTDTNHRIEYGPGGEPAMVKLYFARCGSACNWHVEVFRGGATFVFPIFDGYCTADGELQWPCKDDRLSDALKAWVTQRVKTLIAADTK